VGGAAEVAVGAGDVGAILAVAVVLVGDVRVPAEDEAVVDTGAEVVDDGSATVLTDPSQDPGTSLVRFLYPIRELTCHWHLLLLILR